MLRHRPPFVLKAKILSTRQLGCRSKAGPDPGPDLNRPRASHDQAS